MASFTWATFRTNHIRPFLDDESAGDWSNAELLLYCTWALDDLTLWYPRKRSTTLAADTESFTVPDDFFRVDLVEWKRTDYYWKFLEEISRRPGYEFPSTEVDESSYPVGYWVIDDKLYLGRTSEAAFTLHYHAYWPVPSGDSSEITVPRWARQALAFYIGAMALIRKSIGFAKIRQWNTRTDSGNPLQEPLMPEAKFLLEQYKQIINDHVPLEDIRVYYEGRG